MSRTAGFVCSLLIAVLTATSAHAAGCELRAALLDHQRLDNLLGQKFDKVWYGTRVTDDFNPVDLRLVSERLPSGSALLFYQLSTDQFARFPIAEVATGKIPRREAADQLCVWLIDQRGVVAQLRTEVRGATSRARSLVLADVLRRSLTRDSPAKGWRGVEPANLVIPAEDPLVSPEDTDSVRGYQTVEREPAGALGEASELLLPPAVRDALLSERYDRLFIVPSRNLGSIPYAALPVGETRQLIDLVSLVVLPGFDTFRAASERFGAIERSVVIGDPTLTKPDKLVRKGMFSPLPGARKEAEAVAGLLGVRPMLGADASKAAVLQRVAHSDLIYFATHGAADDVDPNDRSFLVLSDGALTARRIAKLDFRPSAREPFRKAPIVVMSACQTGLGKSFESGVIGLAKAWKHAGAGSIVVSLWSVYDAPTRDLMVRFATALRAGNPPDRALRTAMLQTRDEVRHPVYWAGFTVYGVVP